MDILLFITRTQDLLVTHYDCEENEQKTLHNYAINQVTQCESEPQAIETTNILKSHIILKSPINNTNRIQIYSNIFRKKSTLLTNLKWK